MSYGLSIKNNNNEFLISSDMRNLHHLITISNPSISVPFTNYGGLTRYTYTFTLNSSYIPVPFFTTPFTDRYYAIEKISNSGNTWTVQLISDKGFPNSTDLGTTPSAGQIQTSLSSIQFDASLTGVLSSQQATQGNYFIQLQGVTGAGQGIKLQDGTSYNGGVTVRAVWNGSVVPLVGADSNGIVSLTATNGVIPFNYTADGNNGLVSTDGFTYLPFEDNGTDQPSHVGDNFSLDTTASGALGSLVSTVVFKLKRQSYVSSGSTSGSNATGSYNANQTPKLVVFADARAVTSSDTYGMKVFKDDGTTAFDNRKTPLVVKQVTSVSHPSTATSNFSGGGLSARNASGPTSTWSTQASPHLFNNVSVNSMPTVQMFYYATVTQVHQQSSRTELEEECDGVEVKGNCLGSRRTYTWRSTYWNFYRGAVQRHSNTAIYAGYICVEFGAYHSRTTSGGFFGFNTGNSAGSTVGKWPWDSGQINTSGTGVNTILIADASNYI